MEVLGLVDIPTWICVLFFLLLAGYIYGTWTFGAFDGSGLPGPKPYPFIGTAGPGFIKGFLKNDVELLRKYGKVFRMFSGRSPSIFTTDEDIIKAVCIKEFQNFPNRRNFGAGDELLGSMLSVVGGEQWRRLRHLMSPTFSSGKLKNMNFQVNRCAKLLAENFGEFAANGKSCEVKSMMQAFTMDTIAATAFGLEVNSQKNPDDPFVKMGRKSTLTSTLSPFLIIIVFFPSLMPVLRKLGLSILPMDAMKFFSDITENAMEGRKKETNKPVDFLQLMMNAHEDKDTENDVTDPAIDNGVQNPKEDRKSMSRIEILAQSLLFFIAGFETTAQTLTFLCYSLATNPEVQERLYQEIVKHAGDKDMVDYNTVSQITYLDQCVNEALRLYPPGFRTERTCEKDTTIKGITIKKGWVVTFLVFAMHRDPNLWEDPEAFKPERFEDMSSIGYKFMPFGYGPRNCIGMRLALMEVKVAIVHLLRNYKLVQTEDTLVPFEFNPRKFMAPIKPIQIGVQKRT